MFSPHMEGIHCMAHDFMNLVIHTLIHLFMMSKIEILLQKFYFFSHSQKCHHKFVKLSKLMDIKGNKIFKNIKMCWISMLSPTKWKFAEYKTLFTRMVRDTHMKFLQPKLTLVCYVMSILFNLAWLMPLLRSIHQFIKFLQKRDIYLYEYIRAIKVCPSFFYTFYHDM
jgi:hypothetical protein